MKYYKLKDVQTHAQNTFHILCYIDKEVCSPVSRTQELKNAHVPKKINENAGRCKSRQQLHLHSSMTAAYTRQSGFNERLWKLKYQTQPFAHLPFAPSAWWRPAEVRRGQPL